MNAESNQVQLAAILANFEEALSAQVSDANTVSTVLDKVEAWAGRQPFIMQLLCSYTINYSSTIAKAKNANIVDVIVQQKILKDWESNGAAIHLKKVQETLLNYEAIDPLLTLYSEILHGGILPQNSSPEQTHLVRSGLVTLENGTLSVTNPIYARIFNEDWIKQQHPDTTKPALVIRGTPTLAKASRSPLTSRPLKRRRTTTLLSAVKLPLQVKVAACCFTMLTAAIFVYFQKPKAPETIASAIAEHPEQVAGEIAGEVAEASLNTPGQEEGIQLTLLGDTFSGYSTFRNADFQSVLQDAGIKINYANKFDQTLRLQSLGNGQADVVVTSLDQFLQQQPQGKIVGLLDHTVGADAVVLNTKQFPTLTSLQALKQLVAQTQGKKLSIAYADDTPSEYLALLLDSQFDAFNLSDFELKPVADASDAWALMQDPKENVAIAVLWEPYVTRARQQGYSVVLSSQDEPNAIIDVIVASDRLIQSNPDIISLLLEKYYRRIDSNVRDATQLQTQVAEDGGLDIDEAAAIIGGIDFFTAVEARDWLENGSLEKRIRATAAVLTLANRLEAAPPDTTALYTNQFISEAADNTQALIDIVSADNPELARKLAGNLEITPATPLKPVSQNQPIPDIGDFKVHGQVSFAKNSAQLTKEGKQTLKQLSKELQELNEKTIAVRIIGHTSSTGSASLNQSLSQRRASVVADYLRNMGVRLNITSEGKGFSEPLADMATADIRNQRTEIRIVRVNQDVMD